MGLTGAAGRPAQLSSDEVEKRMLEAGITTIEEAGGLSVSLSHLNLDALIARANVPRSGFYRRWDSKDAFALDLLLALSTERTKPEQRLRSFDRETIGIAHRILLENRELLGSANGRRRLLRTIVKAAVARNFEAVAGEASWRNFILAETSMMSLPSGDLKSRLYEGLRRTDQNFMNAMAEFYEGMAIVLGLKIRAPFDQKHPFQSLARCGAAILEGLILQYFLDEEVFDEEDYRMHDDEEPWPLPALAYLTLLEAMTEEDEQYDSERAAIVLASIDAESTIVPETPANTEADKRFHILLEQARALRSSSLLEDALDNYEKLVTLRDDPWLRAEYEEVLRVVKRP